jgi:hypothetical protein
MVSSAPVEIPSFIVTLATMSIYRGWLSDHERYRSSRFRPPLSRFFYGKLFGIIAFLLRGNPVFCRIAVLEEHDPRTGDLRSGRERGRRRRRHCLNRNRMMAFILAGLTAGDRRRAVDGLAELGLSELRRRAGLAVDCCGCDRRRQPGRRVWKHDRHPDRRLDGRYRPKWVEPAGRACFRQEIT